MKRLLFIAAVALALPAAALAKGPSEVVATGPGLDKGVTLTGLRDGSDIVNATGFFPAVFGPSSDPMLAAPPKGELGPKYTLTYSLPGPGGDTATIVQAVYPYAQPRPVTYMRPGQRFYDGQRTRGGWYVGTAELRRFFPAAQPAVADDGDRAVWPLVAGALALLAALGWAVWFARARWTSAIRTPSVS
jgi:hypothetical protein